MSFHNRAIQSYGSVHASSSLAGAQGMQLTQMLFDGLVDTLVALRGHLVHRSVAAKSAQVTKAHRIVIGLQSTLDFERGGDVARNLNDLYLYVIRRLVHVHAHNDLQALEEITDMMRDIRDAWRSLPGQDTRGRAVVAAPHN
jgi:flagellar protein FliS